MTPTGEALLRSALEKSRNLVLSVHLRVLLSSTSSGFYQKIRVAPGKSGPIGRRLQRQSVAAMNNAG